MDAADPGPLAAFHPVVARWFRHAFGEPTPAQRDGWLAIAAGDSTLIQAPTGGGKTLAAFLWAINRLVFDPEPPAPARCRVVYVSPLKALAVDVERNLRAPLEGILQQATVEGAQATTPTVAVRTGDTPQTERARFRRQPADILITTPESLYLILTSGARDALAHVHTVIVDEVHALVPTKRGAHLALSLERLEALSRHAVQRIGLSATMRPVEEVARFLGGVQRRPRPATRDRAQRLPGWRTGNAEAAAAILHDEFADPRAATRYRPVTVIETGERKRLELRIDVPVEDMARPAPEAAGSDRPASRPSIWAAIHPRLLELVRTHRSTLIFVNSRRVAERLAGALNDLAGEVLVQAHHGSLARERRLVIEEALKDGRVRGLVATSSLELGIDMGAIDLVVLIESPPSVASGLQRAGRGGHSVHGTSRAVLFPKFRADLAACATVTRAMRDGAVEHTRYPRNPLDVLAQQIVAMVAMESWDADDLFVAVRGAAPFAGLERPAFDGVLDMLSGRYPSDEFSELKPRLTWDRRRGRLSAREGARRLAVISGGTIPDRGLYGVFLAGASGSAARVGELDEEMVFETREGETFVLGASTWRVDAITHDRVLVSPAPGEPGKMPFWKADAPGRPPEFGRRIGELTRLVRGMPPPAAVTYLVRHHDLDAPAAEHLVTYLASQAAAAGVVPDDETIVIERCRDELGDWRVCVLSPLGSRIHAPWAMAVAARISGTRGIDVDTMWTNEGFVVRFPDTDDPPDPALLVPASAEVEPLVVSRLGSTSYFAARFREAAGRALLLPRRYPGRRAPLWQQRKRASDLLAVASRYGSFPIVLEAYRECLRDDFDLPALVGLLRQVEDRRIRLEVVDTATPSPFAAAVLFGYVGNFLYDGDAPLAERRAQALTVDQAQLRHLIGTADLRELLEADEIDALEREAQRLAPDRRAASADAMHDLLLSLGDLSAPELAARTDGPAVAWLRELEDAARAVRIDVAGAPRIIAAEHAAQYRDGLGARLPADLPPALLAPHDDPLDEIAGRFARTRGPFTTDTFATRYGLAPAEAEAVLRRQVDRDRLVLGEFRPGGTRFEWCAPDMLRLARFRSRARIRDEAAPVEPAIYGRFLTKWQGVGSGRSGLDAVLDAIEQLQGAPVPASVLEASILPARVADYSPAMLDTLAAAGEIAWIGLEPIGPRDGRIALYLADQLPLLVPTRASMPGTSRPSSGEPGFSEREAAILGALRDGGASFFWPLHDAAGGGYPGQTADAIWSLVWRGLVTSDAFQALRAFIAPPDRSRRQASGAPAFRSRRLTLPSTQGRWSLVPEPATSTAATTRWASACAQQWLARYGIVTREVAGIEGLRGGFATVYPVLRALEEAGRVRRGYFVAGVAATQFARDGAVELVRSLRSTSDAAEAVVLAATDPANPYGAILPWPTLAPGEPGVLPSLARAAGAMVASVDGALAAYWRPGNPDVAVWLPDAEPERGRCARALAEALAEVAAAGEGRKGGLLVGSVNGVPARHHAVGPCLAAAGFVSAALGYHLPRSRRAGARGPG